MNKIAYTNKILYMNKNFLYEWISHMNKFLKWIKVLIWIKFLYKLHKHNFLHWIHLAYMNKKTNVNINKISEMDKNFHMNKFLTWMKFLTWANFLFKWISCVNKTSYMNKISLSII